METDVFCSHSSAQEARIQAICNLDSLSPQLSVCQNYPDYICTFVIMVVDHKPPSYPKRIITMLQTLYTGTHIGFQTDTSTNKHWASHTWTLHKLLFQEGKVFELMYIHSVKLICSFHNFWATDRKNEEEEKRKRRDEGPSKKKKGFLTAIITNIIVMILCFYMLLYNNNNCYYFIIIIIAF